MRVRLHLVLTPATLLYVTTLGPLDVAHAHTKAKAKATAAPVTESAAARAARLATADDVGEHKDVQVSATMTTTQVATGDATDVPPADIGAEPVRQTGPLSGALEDLVARQLARNPAAVGQVDQCLTERKLSGADVTIAITNKLAHLTASNDAALSACLGKVTTLKISMPDQAFAWHFQSAAVASR